ncbi:hypothetical protein K0504_09650 [Neiella marina]|uniref:CBS domain-containing protein n=1 Tax=Neiella holothuriorum TaxID=2870530 RepID=A0ABS7EGH0_9GAMM|nr:hypothetical protein [Neiella holothuriorum]MBW8191300.1 hypothetical protein [Neiella holothuriorum]
MQTELVIYVLVGIVLWDLVKMVYHKLTESRRQRNWSKERDWALDVIECKGHSAHYYMPSIGQREDSELCRALDLLAGQGFIVTDGDGNLVGKVAKARISSGERAEQRRAEFKIVQ